MHDVSDNLGAIPAGVAVFGVHDLIAKFGQLRAEVVEVGHDSGHRLGRGDLLRLGSFELLGKSLASQRRDNPVLDPWGQDFGPLRYGLVGSADFEGGGGHRAAQERDSFVFGHASLNHSSDAEATMVPFDVGILATMVATTYQVRLNEALADAAVDTTALAAAIGVSYQAIKKVREGKTHALSSENNSKAAAYLGVSGDWLATGKGEKRITAVLPAVEAADGSSVSVSTAPAPINLEDNSDYPAIRRVRFKLSAGASGFAVDFIGQDDAPIVFRRDWFQARGFKPEQLFAVRVYNGSMEPGIYDGDVVVVNTGDTAPKDGEAFAVNFEGEMVVKRLIRDAGQWWLASDNPDQRRYPRKVCDERVFIIGRIVHKQSERI